MGQIQLFDLGGLDETSAEAGYSVHPGSRGRGVVTESLRLVTEWAFRAKPDGGLGLRRVSLGTAATNKASRHAAEKAGFVQLGIIPEGFPIGESGFEDEVLYHQLNPSWTE
jgi:RimJ/RimL family protein N-acetyltransferase